MSKSVAGINLGAMQPVIEGFAGMSALTALALMIVVFVQRNAARALRRLASVDPLSGLPNRREFMRALDAEVSRASRSGESFAVGVVDVDRL